MLLCLRFLFLLFVNVFWSKCVFFIFVMCNKYFLYKGVWNNICYYIKGGVIVKCSWKSFNNEMVLNEVIMKFV